VLARAKSISPPPRVDQNEPPLFEFEVGLDEGLEDAALLPLAASVARPSRHAATASLKLRDASSSSNWPSRRLTPSVVLVAPTEDFTASVSPKDTRLALAPADAMDGAVCVGLGRSSPIRFRSFSTCPEAMPNSFMWTSSMSITTSMQSKPCSRKSEA